MLHKSATIYDQPLSWSVIHRHYGRLGEKAQPEVFAPHIQLEDLYWQQAENVLFKLEPALKFWEGLDYVAAPFRSLPVPLGLLDNAVSYSNDLEYGEHSLQYFRESLRRELYIGYLGQQVVEDLVIKQFDYGTSEVEIFTVIEKGIV